VVARSPRVVRRWRWAERVLFVGGVLLVVVALLPARAASDGAQPVSTTTTLPVPPTSDTITPEPEVAGKIVERAPSKVLGDLGEMPRTGGRDERVVAGAGWLLLGFGVLLVDGAGALVRRRTRR
jgi:hypothetical protein